MTPLLALHGLRKQFNTQPPLFEIDELLIQPRSATVLTGPNGSGKSTLLRILGGLESAEIARAEFNGQAISFSPYPAQLRRAIVYVHQHPMLFATSVAANIGYGLRVRGVSGKALAEQVEEAMAWAGVSHLHGHKTKILSGGEKQRVALARARVLKPALLLLDEPTANLDGAAREQVVELIPTLLKEGASIMMASHDPALTSLPGLVRLDLRDGKLRQQERVFES